MAVFSMAANGTKCQVDNPMNNYVEKIDRVRAECGFRNVYKAILGLICDTCAVKIKPGELVTRAAKKTSGPHSFICAKCRPVGDIEKEQDNKKTLTYFVSNSDWFLNANGNALDLLDSITEAVGYSQLKHTRSFAIMVGWHIEKYIDELLAARFFCLLEEVRENFDDRKPHQEFYNVFDAEESPGPRASH